MEIRAALFGEVVEQAVCVCVYVRAHVSMQNDEERCWSVLCSCSGCQVLILTNSEEVFHLRLLN